MERYCFGCGEPIQACFGLVSAGDFAEMLEGTRAPEDVREMCGLCGLCCSLNFDGSPKTEEEARFSIEAIYGKRAA